MWEKIKEVAFDACAIGLACSNLLTFILIAIYGYDRIVEPSKWILYTEIGLDFGFICWGIERWIRDMRNGR